MAMLEGDEVDIWIDDAESVTIESIGFTWTTCLDGTHAVWLSSHFDGLEPGKTYDVHAVLYRDRDGEVLRLDGPLVAEDHRTYVYEEPRTRSWRRLDWRG
jgi:hypothetical protein